MSYAPASLKSLGSYWVKQGGVNLGIVGNTAHIKGYHLGKDRIFDGTGPGIGWNDYSVKTARDKAGLTDAASAIDLGRLDGTLSNLWSFSMWLARECMRNAPDTKDVREVIFWHPSRQRVVGWSDLAPDQLINDYGDLTHKTHTHISYYRDSEGRSKLPLFQRYFVPPVVEEDMVLTGYTPGYKATVKPTANVRWAPKLDASVLIRAVASPGEEWVLTGTVKGDVDPDGGSDQWYVRWFNNRWEYTAKSNVLTAPVAPGVDPALVKELADTKAALTASNTKIANAKAALA